MSSSGLGPVVPTSTPCCPQDPAEERDHQHDDGRDLQPRGGRPGLDAEAVAGLGGHVGRVAETFQQGPDAGLGLGLQVGPGGFPACLGLSR
jgi:hypothetical protein